MSGVSKQGLVAANSAEDLRSQRSRSLEEVEEGDGGQQAVASNARPGSVLGHVGEDRMPLDQVLRSHVSQPRGRPLRATACQPPLTAGSRRLAFSYFIRLYSGLPWYIPT